MRRISTNFLRRDDLGVDQLVGLELVKSSRGIFHIFENIFDYNKNEFKKVELYKSYDGDEDNALDIYGTNVVNRINEGFEGVMDGDELYGIGTLLDYTENYVDSQKGADQPAGFDIYDEMHRKLGV